MFEKIKKFYDMGLYSYAQVEMFLKKGVITEREFVMIVGENPNN